MLEAELFVMAEQMTVEVLGRVRPHDGGILLPPLLGPPARPRTISQASAGHAAEDALVPAVVSGQWSADTGMLAPPGPDDAAQRACASVVALEDGDLVVPTPYGELTVRDYLLQATVARALLAHYVAAYLGSTACPLPEELARPLCELTFPDADRWRALGWFFAPMPLPPHVSWRDRFLLTAGHQPHPLGH